MGGATSFASWEELNLKAAHWEEHANFSWEEQHDLSNSEEQHDFLIGRSKHDFLMGGCKSWFNSHDSIDRAQLQKKRVSITRYMTYMSYNITVHMLHVILSLILWFTWEDQQHWPSPGISTKYPSWEEPFFHFLIAFLFWDMIFTCFKEQTSYTMLVFNLRRSKHDFLMGGALTWFSEWEEHHDFLMGGATWLFILW